MRLSIRSIAILLACSLLTESVKAAHFPWLGVSADRMAHETAAAQYIRVDRTNNRSALGSMNDFVFQLRWRFNEGQTLNDSDRLEDELAEVPMSALNFNPDPYSLPI